LYYTLRSSRNCISGFRQAFSFDLTFVLPGGVVLFHALIDCAAAGFVLVFAGHDFASATASCLPA